MFLWRHNVLMVPSNWMMPQMRRYETNASQTCNKLESWKCVFVVFVVVAMWRTRSFQFSFRRRLYLWKSFANSIFRYVCMRCDAYRWFCVSGKSETWRVWRLCSLHMCPKTIYTICFTCYNISPPFPLDLDKFFCSNFCLSYAAAGFHRLFEMFTSICFSDVTMQNS